MWFHKYQLCILLHIWGFLLRWKLWASVQRNKSLLYSWDRFRWFAADQRQRMSRVATLKQDRTSDKKIQSLQWSLLLFQLSDVVTSRLCIYMQFSISGGWKPKRFRIQKLHEEIPWVWRSAIVNAVEKNYDFRRKFYQTCTISNLNVALTLREIDALLRLSDKDMKITNIDWKSSSLIWTKL